MLFQGLVDKQIFLFDLQIAHLNEYHSRCREVVGPVLKKMGHNEAVEWLYRETEPIG
jgi:Xaa-Pro aminopeptidase